jgi:hypothetical protein
MCARSNLVRQGRRDEESKSRGDDPRSGMACRVAVNLAGADPTLQRTRRRVHYLRSGRKQRRGPSVRDTGPLKPVLRRHSIDWHAERMARALPSR